MRSYEWMPLFAGMAGAVCGIAFILQNRMYRRWRETKRYKRWGDKEYNKAERMVPDLVTGPYSLISVLNLGTGMFHCIKGEEEGFEAIPPIRGKKHTRYEYWENAVAEERIHEDFREEFRSRFSLSRLRREMGRDHESERMVCRQWNPAAGCYRWVETCGILISSGYGFRKMMLYIKDINESHVLEENRNRELLDARYDIKRAESTRYDFVEYVTGDLRCVNDVTRRLAGQIWDAVEKKDYEAAFHYMEQQEDISHYLDVIFADILEAAHMQKFGIILEKDVVDMKMLMTECGIYLDDLRRKKQLSCIWTGSLDGRYIGDKKRLKQCLFKLLENSVQYNRRGGSVYIRLHKGKVENARGEDDFCIEIQDTGTGIPEEQIKNLYEPFKCRGEASDHEAPAGIGLTIAKYILDAMRAKIRVKSVAGEGTKITVWFSLPPVSASSENPACIPLLLRRDKEAG